MNLEQDSFTIAPRMLPVFHDKRNSSQRFSKTGGLKQWPMSIRNEDLSVL
jgi:hypothetical protein